MIILQRASLLLSTIVLILAKIPKSNWGRFLLADFQDICMRSELLIPSSIVKMSTMSRISVSVSRPRGVGCEPDVVFQAVGDGRWTL